MPHSSKATYGDMVYSTMELMVVLMNLALIGHHGRPCTRPGAVSRVAVWEFPVWSPSVL
jgi:hypothetical protein